MDNQKVEIYTALFTRELEKLTKEVNAFDLESDLWITKGGITNTAGNLSLHLIGNLSTYIGRLLGGSSYVRDREFEFGGKDVPRGELIRKIDETQVAVSQALRSIGDSDLTKVYPEQVLGYEMTTDYFLSHLLSHFSYHLGQINYLRRMIEG